MGIWSGLYACFLRILPVVLVCISAGVLASDRSAGAEEVEFLDAGIEGLLFPGSRLLDPGMHVHACGDAVDLYVTEKVSLLGNTAVAVRKAYLDAARRIVSFSGGTGGSRTQEVEYTETSRNRETVRSGIRHLVQASGVVAGLRIAARATDGNSARMVFVLPVSDSHPTADCLP